MWSYRDRDGVEYAGAAGGYIDYLGYPFCRGRILSQIEEDHGQYNDIQPIFWATGAAFVIRLETYQQVGGLDEFFFAHMEEVDLCWRLRSRGYGIVCIPDSIVYHVGGATLSKNNPRKTYLNFRNNLLMIYKNSAVNKLKGIILRRCILDSLAMLHYLLGGDVKNANAVVKAWRDYCKTYKQFSSQRHDNLQKTIVHCIPEIYKSSILWQYYVKQKRRFAQLSNFKI